MRIIYLLLFFCCLTVHAKKHPNVVYFFSDQQNVKTINCYGAVNQNTPNIDKLATQGIKLENAISSWPVCSPYRAMMITGKYPFNNGVVTNSAEIYKGIPTMAEFFKKSGYMVGYSGKWHLYFGGMTDVPEEDRCGFDDYWEEVFPLKYRRQGLPAQYRTEGKKGSYFAGYNIDRGIDFIEMAVDANKPFLAVISVNPPHPQYFALESDLAKKPADTVIPYKTYGQKPFDLPSGAPYNFKPPSDTAQDIFENRDSFIENVLRPYNASCEAIDTDFGRLVQKLKDLGIEKETILIYTSDHGDMMGAHNMVNKYQPFEESIKVPFIIRYPAKLKENISSDVLLSPIDILPTILDLADIDFDAKQFDGISLAPALQGKKDAMENDAVLIMNITGPVWRGVRTKQFTYCEMNGREWFMCDNIKDPDQEVNVIKDPEYAEIKERLKTRMQELLAYAGDNAYQHVRDTKKYNAIVESTYLDRLEQWELNNPTKESLMYHYIQKKKK